MKERKGKRFLLQLPTRSVREWGIYCCVQVGIIIVALMVRLIVIAEKQ